MPSPRNRTESLWLLRQTLTRSTGPTLRSSLARFRAKLFDKFRNQIRGNRFAISRRGTDVVNGLNLPRNRSPGALDKRELSSLAGQHLLGILEPQRHRRNASHSNAYILNHTATNSC